MKSGDNRGFTLIEMAIVLVIIGIIIGAVVKGQDLVDNAKSKQFASKLQAWQIALNTYYDRKGRYPGDDDRNGIIASGGTLTPLEDINSARFDSPPEATFTIGGAAFTASLGNDGGTTPRNYLAITKSTVATYDPTNSADRAALKYFEAYDTAIDGSADPTQGQVVGATGATIAAGAKLTALTVATTPTVWMDGASAPTPVFEALALQIK